MKFQVNALDDVTMQLPSVEASPGSLAFTYLITNRSLFRVYLVNQLFHRRGTLGFQVDPDLVYAELTVESILCVRKRLIEVPEELDVEAPEVPYVTPIEAGSSFQERISLQFPIRLHDPYRHKSGPQKLLLASQFIFQLGYILEVDPIRISEVTLPAGTKHWRIDYLDLLRNQRIKEIGPIHAELQVMATT